MEINNSEQKTQTAITNDNEFIKNNIDILQKKIDSNIYISLATTAQNIISHQFEKVLESLYNQKISAQKIIVNVYENFKEECIENAINTYTEKFNNVIFNYSQNYNVMTKIIGLTHSNIQFNDSDIIIFVNNNFEMTNVLTYFYGFAYDMYNVDGVIANKNNSINLFYDCYDKSVCGQLTFSFKYKHIAKLYSFCHEIIKYDENIWQYDDLIVSCFYITEKLYCCGMNVIMHKNFINETETQIKNYCELYTENNIFDIYKIDYNHDTYELMYTYDREKYLEISKDISKRNYLTNPMNISYNPEDNNFHEIHLDIKYISTKIFALTITMFNDYLVSNLNCIIKINDITYTIVVNKEYLECSKFTVFCHTSEEIIPFLYPNFDHTKIIQTTEQNIISLNKFYSICTILSNIPYITYKLFDKEDRINFINSRFHNVLKYYNKLIPGAYKADLFRALYLYKNGGIYFDCKNILFSDIAFLINKNEIFIKDSVENYTYNGNIICINANNIQLRKYICHMIYNIYNELMCANPVCITGPGLLGKYIIATDYMFKHDTENFHNSYTCCNKKIIIKNGYYNYYSENDYFNKKHYDILWKNNEVYNLNENNKLNLNDKINGIELIVWINLNRSKKRFDNMSELLKRVDVKNIRIEAIDGLNPDIRNTCNVKNFQAMSNLEIACTLSHLKAIHTISNYANGDYFMICEDDITFNSIEFFNVSISDIIKNCPEFDILKLHHINSSSDELYCKWKRGFYSTVCYIINVHYAKKISETFTLNNDNFIFKDENVHLDVADVFIYQNAKSYVYKYNYISTKDEDSEIHPSHLNIHRYGTFIKTIDIINNLII